MSPFSAVLGVHMVNPVRPEPRKSPAELLTTRIRAAFGPYYLVELYSGRWAPIWHECVADEDTCTAILVEDADWFNLKPDHEGDVNPTYATKVEALRVLVDLFRRDSKKAGQSDEIAAWLVQANSGLLDALEDAAGQVGVHELRPPGPERNPSDAAPLTTDELVNVVAPSASDPTSGNDNSAAHQTADNMPPGLPAPWENVDGIKGTKLLFVMPPEIVCWR